MTTSNNSTEEELIDGPILISGKLTRRIEVPPMMKAVVIVGGEYYETLPSGLYYAAKYPLWKPVELYYIDVRERRFVVQTTGKLEVFINSAPIPIDLTLGINYRVATPYIVACVIDNPLGTLQSYTIEAMRDVCKSVSADDFLQVSDFLRSDIFKGVHERLEARLNQGQNLGVQILDVQIIHQGLNERYKELLTEEGIRDREIKITLRELELTHELRQKLADELRNLDKFAIVTALENGDVSIINSLIGDKTEILTKLIEAARQTGDLRIIAELIEKLNTNPNKQAIPLLDQPNDIQTSELLLTQGSTELSGIQKLFQDITRLRGKGFLVNVSKGDGDYNITVSINDDTTIYFVCSQDYPADKPPAFSLVKDGEDVNFSSMTIRDWSSEESSIVKVVEEVIQFYSVDDNHL